MDTDANLLQRYATTRDATAFAELARRYRSMVFSVGRRVTGNAHDAEDVAQGCFIQLAAQAGQVSVSLPGWLHTAAVRIGSNINRDAVRRRKREQARAELSSEPDDERANGAWTTVGPQVDAALEKLPEEVRVPLILHFLQDRTQVEIAEELNVSRATIARRLADGVERLRENLARAGAFVSAFALVTFMQAHAVQAAPPTLVAELGRMAIAGVGAPAPVAPAPVAPASAWSVTLFMKWFAGLGMAKAAAMLLLVIGLAVGLATSVQAIATGPQPYDLIHDALNPYLDPADPLAFPMKSAALSDSAFKFWRGSKDLYYRWAKTNAADWLADDGSYVTSHGDLHPGNIGAYATAPNRLAFGLVDFDDATRLPFQLELTHGLISLHLAAADAGVSLEGDKRAALDAALFDAYTAGLSSEAAANALLKADRTVAKLLGNTGKPYASELKDYVDKRGRFVSAVATKKGNVKELLRAADDRADAIASGVAEAIAGQPSLKRAFKLDGVAAVRQSIKSVAVRTRVGSSGSQGLKKYFVLMASPMADVEGDVIVYLKQQVPTAAERAGIVPLESRTPAERCVQAMSTLLPQRPWACGSVELGGESYWLSVKEPWSDELDVATVNNFDDLLAFARVWGAVTGSAHRRATSDSAVLLSRLTSESRSVIAERVADYEEQLSRDYASFLADPRVAADLKSVSDAIAAVRNEAQANINSGSTK